MTQRDVPEQDAAPDWHLKTEMTLLILAQKAELLTYDDLAHHVGVPAPHRIHKLTNFLEALMEEDIKTGAPIRAAVVISKIRGLPAPGFFDVLDRCQMTYDRQDTLGAHHAMLKALNPAFGS